MKLTKEQAVKSLKKKLDYEDADMFMHCKNCLPADLGDLPPGESAGSFMDYQGSSLRFTYANGKSAMVFVMWCKKCHQSVWDSRHLQPWL